MKYKNIIYPVGGNSELAELATRHAAYLAGITGAKLVLVYVEDKIKSWEGFTSNSPEWQKIEDDWIKEGQEILDQEEQRLNALGVKNIEKVIRHGKVADEIVALAEERQADLIVLASQKKSPFGKLFMGSHTYSIFTKATCPILRIVR